MQIDVNGKQMFFTGSQITYQEIVALAEMTGEPSVTYHGRRHGDSQRSGMMSPGCKAIELEEGMNFNVAHTGNA